MAIDVIIGALIGGGLAEGVNALTHTPKQPGLPSAPDMGVAQDTATNAQTQQRQASLAAGGQTNVTGGSGIILGSDVNSVTLVGTA